MEGHPWYNGVALVCVVTAGVLSALVTIASSGRGFYFAINNMASSVVIVPAWYNSRVRRMRRVKCTLWRLSIMSSFRMLLALSSAYVATYSFFIFFPSRPVACPVALCGACIVFALDGDNISCLISIVNSVFDIFSCFFSMVNFVYISVLFCTIRGHALGHLWGSMGPLYV